MNNGRIHERLGRLSAILDGIVPGVPLIELIADKRVFIENHCGICQYTREHICVYAPNGVVRICGQKLFLERMTKEQLIITGRIDGVYWCRGKSGGN